jgi:plastocyanin
MKSTAIIVLLIAIVVLLSGCATKTLIENNTPVPDVVTNTPSSHFIEIKDNSFIPETLTIHKGDTVSWINNDAAKHTVTSDSGSELQSDILPQSMSYVHTFDTAGTYTYHCEFHSNMIGKIIVE